MVYCGVKHIAINRKIGEAKPDDIVLMKFFKDLAPLLDSSVHPNFETNKRGFKFQTGYFFKVFGHKLKVHHTHYFSFGQDFDRHYSWHPTLSQTKCKERYQSMSTYFNLHKKQTMCVIEDEDKFFDEVFLEDLGRMLVEFQGGTIGECPSYIEELKISPLDKTAENRRKFYSFSQLSLSN